MVGVLVFTGTMRNLETWLVEKGLNVSLVEYQLLGENQKPEISPSKAAELLAPEAKAMIYQKAPELVSPSGYINTEGYPVTIGEHQGKKVILIDFWTYSCINCQRTLPYLKMWYEKYKDQGLEIISVHTPEFAFEKVQANVEKAAKGFELEYPVVLDNEYRTWNAFDNHYWPRKYLIDIDGYIVYDHAGEGNYEATEEAIQKALAERAARLNVPMAASDTKAPNDLLDVDFSQVRSPEIYFGSARNEHLGSGVAGKSGTPNIYLSREIRRRYPLSGRLVGDNLGICSKSHRGREGEIHL